MKYDVCVVGGCSIDRTFYQNTDGSYNKVPNVIAPGGKGANQAVAASRAGAKTTIITKLGKDEIGKNIMDNLAYNYVDTTNVELSEGIDNDCTDIYVNLADKDNDIHRTSGAINEFSTDMIDNHEDTLTNSIIIMSQLKCPIEVTERLINFCYENNKILILTPCRPKKLINKKDLIDKIPIITCNKEECETIFETQNIEECVTKYPNKLIVTLGPDGLMYHNGERIVKMPALNVSVLDTTGAGDTLAGNLAAFLSKGLDLKQALRKAMYASSMKITQKTAQQGMPYKEDLEMFISNYRSATFKYKEELELALKIVKDSYHLVKSNRNFTVTSKKDDTLVTDVDIAIEKYLINKIQKQYPEDNFLTEENYPNNELSNRTWIIDPIDGTTHFIKNDCDWGIQLAFYADGSTKFSIIYLPKKEELYYAMENKGAYLNSNKILTQDIKKLPLKQCVIEFGGSLYKHFDEKKIIFSKLLEDHKYKIANIVHLNASCISYTNLATHRTDGLIVSTNKPWDIMPGECLCKEVGIRTYPLDFNGNVKLLTDNENVKETILKENITQKDMERE